MSAQKTLADTGLFIALFDPDDTLHARAVAFMLPGNRRFVNLLEAAR